MDQLIKRYKNNPILTKEDIPYPVATVHNAGVIKFDNKYMMIFFLKDDERKSYLGRLYVNIAISKM